MLISKITLPLIAHMAKKMLIEASLNSFKVYELYLTATDPLSRELLNQHVQKYLLLNKMSSRDWWNVFMFLYIVFTEPLLVHSFLNSLI